MDIKKEMDRYKWDDTDYIPNKKPSCILDLIRLFAIPFNKRMLKEMNS